jgi:protein TonB
VLRISLAAAVVFHVLLFMVQFPEMTREVTAAPQREQQFFVVEQPKFKPPEVQRRQEALRPRQVRVPIPDPTPDEPEPLREPEPEQTVQVAVRDDELFGVPAAPAEPGEEGAPIPVGQVKEPKRLVEVKPVYPEEARKARLEGVVIVEIIVDKKGNVKDVRVIRPLSLGLTEAAQDAVKQWKYEPTTYNGRPVEVLITVTVRFSLQ